MRTELCRRLGIEHPIIQAPMAGVATPAMAAAVSEAGGLGSLGCGAHTPEQLQEDAAALRGRTNRAFNLNFFVHRAPEMDQSKEAVLRERLAPLFEEFGLGEVPPARDLLPPFGADQLDVLLGDPPAIASFHFGLPDAKLLAPLKEAGSLIVSSATTVAEAKWLEANGADAIVAQGAEAGGHRGTFLSEAYDGAAMIGTMALVPQVADAVSVPVIAAGGIGDGRGIAAALALGAEAVLLGTAFLDTDEAATDPLYRTELRKAQGEDTTVTKTFSGRPARAIRNRYVDFMSGVEDGLLDFPLPYIMNAALRAAGAKTGNRDLPALWSGQAPTLARQGPAGKLVTDLAAETRTCIAGLAASK